MTGGLLADAIAALGTANGYGRFIVIDESASLPPDHPVWHEALPTPNSASCPQSDMCVTYRQQDELVCAVCRRRWSIDEDRPPCERCG